MTATPSFLDLRGGPLRPGRASARPLCPTHWDNLALAAADRPWRPTGMFAATVAAGIGVRMLAIAGIRL
jgi:hypothetical protein